MSRPKALLEWQGGRSFIRNLIEWCSRAGCELIVVVVGAPHGASVRAAVETGSTLQAVVVTNPDPSRGMLSSLQIGLEAALSAGASRVMFTPVDLPISGPEPIDAVLEAHGDVVLPTLEGRTGHPVVLSPRAARALIEAPTSRTPRDVLEPFARVTVEVSDPGVCGNVNTPADLERWRGAGEPT